MNTQELNDFMLRTVLSNQDGPAHHVVHHTTQQVQELNTFSMYVVLSLLVVFIAATICIAWRNP